MAGTASPIRVNWSWFDRPLIAGALALARARARLVSRNVMVDGVPCAYLERAGDGPTIVLLHGFASEKDAWIRFVPHLPARFRVIAPDLPGHGDNPWREHERHDAPALAARVAALLAALGLLRAHLAGNSLGGLLALLVAHAHPDRVRSLCLMDPAGVEAPDASEFDRLLAAGDNPLIVGSRAAFDRLVALLFEKSPVMPWPVRAVLARRFAARATITQRIWDDLWTHREPVDALLPSVRTPTLLVWGEGDRILDPSCAALFAAGLPRCEVHRMARTGHSPMVERPRATAALYSAFLSGVEVGDQAAL